MNMRMPSQFLAIFASSIWALRTITTGTDAAWLPFLSPAVTFAALGVGTLLVVAGLQVRQTLVIIGGYAVLAIGAFAAGGATVDAWDFLGAFALLASAEAAAAGSRLAYASSSFYRAAAPIVATAAVVGLAAVAAPIVLRNVLPMIVARSLDAESVYAPFMTSLGLTGVLVAVLWTRGRWLARGQEDGA